MEHFVPMPTPVVFLYTTRVANYDSSNITFNTLFSNLVRQLVTEIRRPSGQLLTSPFRTVAWTVRTFRLVLFSLEVMLVLFQRVSRVQDRLIGIGNSSRDTNPKVNTSNFVAWRLFRHFHLVHNVNLVLCAVPHGSDLAYLAYLTILRFLVVDDDILVSIL
jgi:hypothetical protein